ncbi:MULTISPECIES: hypothetical protein [unclassified Pseudomonas]|uniref:hypothetical protein n=1 Tax=unclassified Pseudomonas TaxID=196821 RepID=UPI001912CFD0|nr:MULTISPECIES: hypothetical protein [unclassified Pseudomonas]MBK5549991.1 hypothetical protein [Pseudomonas sp. TH03]MEB0228675.1 hypothetical protein [Pseudomonas sp. 5S1]MEB0297798.1 hypothetical protein [Pseudomonas sp. 10S4]WPX21116.1 hypothetical protein RHM58_15430 [Pseudomonas sp. 10S4]
MTDAKAATLVEVPGSLRATATHGGQQEEFKEEGTVSYRYVSDAGLRFLDSRPVNGFRMNIGVSVDTGTGVHVINNVTTDALVIFRGSRTNTVAGVMRVDQNDADGLSGAFNGTTTLNGIEFEISCTEFKIDTTGNK